MPTIPKPERCEGHPPSQPAQCETCRRRTSGGPALIPPPEALSGPCPRYVPPKS
jgi:hypothetical protein